MVARIMGASAFTDKHGDVWTVRPDGFIQCGTRVLKFSTVAQQLGPLHPKTSHADVADDPAGLAAELEAARLMATAGQMTDEQKLVAVRRLAAELTHDPYRVDRELVGQAIKQALGEAD